MAVAVYCCDSHDLIRQENDRCAREKIARLATLAAQRQAVEAAGRVAVQAAQRQAEEEAVRLVKQAVQRQAEEEVVRLVTLQAASVSTSSSPVPTLRASFDAGLADSAASHGLQDQASVGSTASKTPLRHSNGFEHVILELKSLLWIG